MSKNINLEEIPLKEIGNYTLTKSYSCNYHISLFNTTKATQAGVIQYIYNLIAPALIIILALYA